MNPVFHVKDWILANCESDQLIFKKINNSFFNQLIHEDRRHSSSVQIPLPVFKYPLLFHLLNEIILLYVLQNYCLKIQSISNHYIPVI